MRPTDLADPAWLAATVREHHRALGLSRPPGTVDLLDVCIKNPHRPDSPRCRGWATVRVAADAVTRAGDALLLLRTTGGAVTEPGSGMPLTGLPVCAWRFPDDPDLPFLGDMTDPDLVRDLLPADLGLARSVEQVQVVRWQPGVSATLRCVLSGAEGAGAVYAKLLAHGDLAAVEARQRRLYADAPVGLRVAEPLGVDPARRILWTREVAGRNVLTGPAGEPELTDRVAELTGRALSALHTPGLVRPERTVTPGDVVAEAAKKARKIAAAQPRHDSAVGQLTALVAGLLGGSSYRRRPLHGDFHLEQLLLTEHDLVLLDLDEMATGDPALDLAELAVDLGLRRLPAETTAHFLTAVGRAYTRAGGTAPTPAVLRGYAAAELLNRCYRRLRRPVPGWEQALEDDLGRADVVLAGAGMTAQRIDEEVRA